MKIQVNSDKTIRVDARVTKFVEGEADRVLGRFARMLTRVEVHLSDVDNRKTGKADKRCMVEARPTGARPRTATAKAADMASAIGEAMGKMQRSLTTFFGKQGRAAGASPAAGKTTAAAKKKPAAKKSVEEAIPVDTRKKPKRIYKARRQAWPAR